MVSSDASGNGLYTTSLPYNDFTIAHTLKGWPINHSELEAESWCYDTSPSDLSATYTPPTIPAGQAASNWRIEIPWGTELKLPITPP